MEGATNTKPKKERTPAQQEAFEKARLMNAMHEGSPRERHEKKVYDALHHIHGWGFSTSILTARACRTKSTSFLTVMKKAGLIRHEDVLGRNYVLLTRKGLELLRNVTDPEDAIAWQRAQLTHTHTVSLFAFQHNDYIQSLIAKNRPCVGTRIFGSLSASSGCGWRKGQKREPRSQMVVLRPPRKRFFMKSSARKKQEGDRAHVPESGAID